MKSICLRCLEVLPFDELAERVFDRLKVGGFSLNEIADLLVFNCACGSRACFCEECQRVIEGKPYEDVEPCPTMAKETPWMSRQRTPRQD